MAGRGRRAPKPTNHRLIAGVALAAVLAAGGLAWGLTSGAENAGGEAVSFGDVHGIALDPQDPRVLYVATHHGLVRGVDGGGWTRVGESEDDLMGFSIHPEDGRTFWSSGHPKVKTVDHHNLGVRISQDGGVTWERIALEGVDFHAMAVSPADPTRLWGVAQGGLQRSLDGGYSWEALGAAPERTAALTAHPQAPDTLFAATPAGVQRSDDGGRTWTAAWPVPALALAIDPSDPDVLYVANDAGVLKSTDGGATWSATPLEPSRAPVGFLALSREAPGLVVAATFDGAIHRSTDGGATWTAWREAEA